MSRSALRAGGGEKLEFYYKKSGGDGAVRFRRFPYLCGMTSLPRHIEILLLEHNCVIIPQFGGFVAQTMPARRVADEQTMLPAYRTVGFSAQLRMNDGLLAQSYMHTMGVGYAEAMAAISDDVMRLREQLYREGRCELGGVGSLYQKVDGGYEFEPLLAGVTSPALYGLDAFRLNSIMENNKETTEDKPATPAEAEKDSRHYTLRVNKEVVNYVAAALVALVFYLAWALPGHHDAPQTVTEQASVVNAAPTTPTVKDKAPAAAAHHPAKQVNTPAAAQTEAPALAAPNERRTAEAKGPYALVMATAVTAQGAQHLVEQLAREGYPAARTVKKGKLLQVVCGHYATEAEARERLSELRGVSYFHDSWVTRTAE